MISSRGTRAVSIKRKKTGLEFSIKGGKEHGIGVVVSWIKEGGAAASSLRLGDEILAVNSRSVQGRTHSQVVGLLKNAGPVVSLLVKPNQTLEDIFSKSTLPPPPSLQETWTRPTDGSPLQKLLPSPSEDSQSSKESTEPLPPGWANKTDHKTGRMYFENHYTKTTTWCDPRTRNPLPLDQYRWNSLPPGWERFLDSHGDIYYVNHHTQTTHWDSPAGARHQLLLTQLVDFIKHQTEKVKTVEESLAEKRKMLLEKNQKLSLLPEAQRHLETKGDEGGGGESSADLVEDMMLLNEEAESSEEELARLRRHLQTLLTILQKARQEDLGEREEHQEAAELAVLLAKKHSQHQQMIQDLNTLVQSVSSARTQASPMDTPLQYMLQLPSAMEDEQLKEKVKWLHVLPDRLTPKTTTELRVESVILEEALSAGQQIHDKLELVHHQASSNTSSNYGNSWDMHVEKLASLDFQPIYESSSMSDLSFQEKLDRLLVF